MGAVRRAISAAVFDVVRPTRGAICAQWSVRVVRGSLSRKRSQERGDLFAEKVPERHDDKGRSGQV